jgi:hypothetical protein
LPVFLSPACLWPAFLLRPFRVFRKPHLADF